MSFHYWANFSHLFSAQSSEWNVGIFCRPHMLKCGHIICTILTFLKLESYQISTWSAYEMTLMGWLPFTICMCETTEHPWQDISDFTCIIGGRWHVCPLSALKKKNGKIQCWSYISIYFHARWYPAYYSPMLTSLRKSSSNSSLEIKRPVGFKQGQRSRLIRVHPASSPQRRLSGVEILSEAPRVCGVNLKMIWWSDVLTWAKTCTAAETGSVPRESRIQDGEGDTSTQVKGPVCNNYQLVRYWRFGIAASPALRSQSISITHGEWDSKIVFLQKRTFDLWASKILMAHS